MPDVLYRSPYLSAVALGNASSETQFTGAGSAVATCRVPLTTATLNRPMRIIAGGRVLAGAAMDFTARLYWGGSSTIASNTSITTAVTSCAASTQQLWMIDVTIGGTQTSATDPGTISIVYVGTTGTAAAALTTTDQGLPNALISITGTFGSSNASNTAYLDWFEIQSVVGG